MTQLALLAICIVLSWPAVAEWPRSHAGPTAFAAGPASLWRLFLAGCLYLLQPLDCDVLACPQCCLLGPCLNGLCWTADHNNADPAKIPQTQSYYLYTVHSLHWFFIYFSDVYRELTYSFSSPPFVSVRQIKSNSESNSIFLLLACIHFLYLVTRPWGIIIGLWVVFFNTFFCMVHI